MPWSASDGSRLTSGPDKSFSIAMSPGVSIAPSEAAERCTAAAVSASELTGRSGDRHDLRSVDPRLRRQPT